MSYTRYKSATFGPGKSGLSTVGYTLTGGSRITAGVAEIGTATGSYGATVTFADSFVGSILWDTGDSPVAYAAEEVNPGPLATPGNPLATDSSGRVLLQPSQPGVVIPTVTTTTNLTNLPSIPSNWLTAAGIAASALNGKGDWLTSLGTNAPTGWINAAAIASAALNGKGDWLLSSSYAAPLDAAGTRAAVGLTSANLDGQLSAIAGYIDTEVAAIKAKTDNLPASPAATSDIPTSTVVAVAVWGLTTTGHTASGTFGAAMNAAGSAGDPWATNIPGAYGAGTAGNIVGNRSGYKLASDGLDAISTADPGGVANTFPKMVVQLWRRFFKGSAKDATGLTIKTFADNGTTVRTTQTYTDDGDGNETLGAAT